MDIEDKLERKLDNISEDISEIKVTLYSQHQQLVSHIKRTELAEESIKLLRDEMKPIGYILRTSWIEQIGWKIS